LSIYDVVFIYLLSYHPAKKENGLVAFKIDRVNVVHWESGIKKTVVLNESEEDLLSSFAMGCRQAFPDDLAHSKFKIYALAHNYNHDDISDRQRILTSAALQEVLLEQGRFDIVPRELHVFKDTADTSSEKARSPDTDSVASAETRDTQASLNCRAAAAYTCAFCQFHLGSNTGVAAAHIFELEHYNAIPTAEARTQALREKCIGHIHGGMNLICLCNDCHSQFNAPYNIGINPRTSEIEISGNVLSEYCNNTLFKNLVGKKVIFTKGWRPPRALLKYRYKFFEEGGKIETKKRRKKSSVDEGAVAKVQKIEVAPPAGMNCCLRSGLVVACLFSLLSFSGYTVLPKLDKDPGGAGASSSSARTCVCRTTYINGGACQRCKKFSG
jgi:hypothetical protein